MSLLKLKPYALAIAVALALLTNPVCAQVANIGFENGDFSGWTIGGPTGTKTPTSFNGNGAGVSIITGIENLTQGNPNQGGPYTWNVTPLGTYMASLQAANGTGNTFNDMVAGLGLSQSSVTSLTTMLTQQAQATGNGQGNPTNGSWITIPLVLNAGDSFSMSWNYISTDYVPFNDGSITTLVNLDDNTINGVVNNENAQYALLGFTNPGTGNYSTGSYASTGWQTSTYSVTVAGNYLLGFGSFNLDDTALSPILMVDEAPGQTFNGTTVWGAIAPNEGSSAPDTSSGSSNTPPPPVVTNSEQVTSETIIGTSQTNVNVAYGSTTNTPVTTYSSGLQNPKIMVVTKTITTTSTTPVTTTTTVTTPITTVVTTTPVTTTTYNDGTVEVAYGTPESVSTTVDNVIVGVVNSVKTEVSAANQYFDTRVDQFANLRKVSNHYNLLLDSNPLDRHYNGIGEGNTPYFISEGGTSNKVATYTFEHVRIGGGIERFVKSDLLLGVQYNYVWSQMDGYKSNGDIEKNHFGVYGLYKHNDWLVKFDGNIAYNKSTYTRKLPELGLTSKGKVFGEDYWTAVKVYSKEIKGFRPFVGARYENNTTDKFTEKGDALTSLAWSALDSTDTTGEIGLRYDRYLNKAFRLYGEASINSQEAGVIDVGATFKPHKSLTAGLNGTFTQKGMYQIFTVKGSFNLKF